MNKLIEKRLQLTNFISDCSQYFKKGHLFFSNSSEIDMEKVTTAISNLKEQAKTVDRKNADRHSAVPKVRFFVLK